MFWTMFNKYCKGQYNAITIMKVMATCLITWFHFKWTVPKEFASIFIGGAIGNSLFFFCSGYLLKFKEERYRGEWLVRKYIRIMPSVWVFMLFMLLCNSIRNTATGYIWYNWAYPTPYWFVNSILCFFAITYFLKLLSTEKKSTSSPWSAKQFYCIGMVVVCLQMIWYIFLVNHEKVVMDEGGIKCWFFFLFFLWGYYSKSLLTTWKSGLWRSAQFPVAVACFFIYKKLAPFHEVLLWLQVLLIPVLLVWVVYGARSLAFWIASMPLPHFIQKFLILLSNLTLDIYVVQVYLIQWLMPKMAFPLNIFVLLPTILLAALINKYFADKIGRFILKYV